MDTQIFKILTVSMKDLAAGLNAKFKFTYTSLIFAACAAEPVTWGVGSGGVMHTNQIKPVHAVRTHPALRHGGFFGWADSETNFEKLDKHALPLWMIYCSKCYEWSCCEFGTLRSRNEPERYSRSDVKCGWVPATHRYLMSTLEGSILHEDGNYVSRSYS